jgi:hypothetical protein
MQSHNYANPAVDILREAGSVVTEKQLYMIMDSGRGLGDFQCAFCEKKFSRKSNRTAHFKICKQVQLSFKIVKQQNETKNQVPVLHGTGDREGNSVVKENGKTHAATSQAPVHKPPSAIQEWILMKYFF